MTSETPIHAQSARSRHRARPLLAVKLRNTNWPKKVVQRRQRTAVAFRRCTSPELVDEVRSKVVAPRRVSRVRAETPSESLEREQSLFVRLIRSDPPKRVRDGRELRVDVPPVSPATQIP